MVNDKFLENTIYYWKRFPRRWKYRFKKWAILLPLLWRMRGWSALEFYELIYRYIQLVCYDEEYMNDIILYTSKHKQDMKVMLELSKRLKNDVHGERSLEAYDKLNKKWGHRMYCADYLFDSDEFTEIRHEYCNLNGYTEQEAEELYRKEFRRNSEIEARTYREWHEMLMKYIKRNKDRWGS